MRFFNSVSELETALDTCLPLRSLFAHDPVYLRSADNKKAWVLEGPVTIVKNRTETRKQLLQFVTDVQLSSVTSDGIADCTFTLHAAHRHVFELIIRRHSLRYRHKNDSCSTRPEWQHNPLPFPPARKRVDSYIFRRYHRFNGMLYSMRSLPSSPFIPAQQPEVTVQQLMGPKADNVTTFPKVVKPPKTEKPGT